jgi:hypothetical protein
MRAVILTEWTGKPGGAVSNRSPLAPRLPPVASRRPTGDQPLRRDHQHALSPATASSSGTNRSPGIRTTASGSGSQTRQTVPPRSARTSMTWQGWLCSWLQSQVPEAGGAPPWGSPPHGWRGHPANDVAPRRAGFVVPLPARTRRSAAPRRPASTAGSPAPGRYAAEKRTSASRKTRSTRYARGRWCGMRSGSRPVARTAAAAAA